MKRLVMLTAAIGLLCCAQTSGSTKSLGLLVRNASALDTEERAAYEFAAAHGFTVTRIDAAMIQSNPAVLDEVQGFWADNGSEPVEFNNPSVSKPLLDAINSGKGILFRQFGGFVGQYLRLGKATTGTWYPVYADAEYFVQAQSSHPVFQGIPTWLDHALPNKPEQLIERVHPGRRTGAGIDLSDAQGFEITKIVEAWSLTGHDLQRGVYVSEKRVGQGVALFLPVNGFTVMTLGPVGVTMYANALDYISRQVSSAAPCDEFDGASMSTSMWEVSGESWSQAGGQITGYWDVRDPHADQANLLLAPSQQPAGDYTFEADMVMQPGWYGHRIVLWHSPGNKYNIWYHGGGQGVGVEVKQNGGIYNRTGQEATGLSYFDATAGAVAHAKVVKAGNRFTFFLNGNELFTLVESIWNGDVRIGIGSYGYAAYTRACVTHTAPLSLEILSLYCEVNGRALPVIAFNALKDAILHVVVSNTGTASVSGTLEFAVEDITGCSETSALTRRSASFQQPFVSGVTNFALEVRSILTQGWEAQVTFGNKTFEGRKVKFTAHLAQGSDVQTTATNGAWGKLVGEFHDLFNQILSWFGSTGNDLTRNAAPGSERSTVVLFDKWGLPGWTWTIRDVYYSGSNKEPAKFWNDAQAKGEVLNTYSDLASLGFNTVLLGEYYEPDEPGVYLNDDLTGFVGLISRVTGTNPGGFTFPANSYALPPKGITASQIKSTIDNIRKSGISHVLAYAAPADLAHAAVALPGTYRPENAAKCDNSPAPLRLLETSNLRTAYDCAFFSQCNSTTEMQPACSKLELSSLDKTAQVDCALFDIMRLLQKPLYLSEGAGYVPNFENSYNSTVATDLAEAGETYGFDGFLIDDMGRFREVFDADCLWLMQRLLQPDIVASVLQSKLGGTPGLFDASQNEGLPEPVRQQVENLINGIQAVKTGASTGLQQLQDWYKRREGEDLTEKLNRFRLTKEDISSPLYPTVDRCNPPINWYAISDLAWQIRNAVKSLKNGGREKIIVSSDYYTHQGWESQPYCEDVYASDKAPIYSVHWANLALAAKESTLKPVRTDLMHAKLLAPLMLTRQREKLFEIAMGLAWSQGAYVQFGRDDVLENRLLFKQWNWFKQEHEGLFAPGQEAEASTHEQIWHPLRPELGSPPFTIESSDGRPLRLEYGLGNVVPIAYKQSIEGGKRQRFILFLTNTYNDDRGLSVSFDPPSGKLESVAVHNLKGSEIENPIEASPQDVQITVRSFCVLEYVVRISDTVKSVALVKQ